MNRPRATALLCLAVWTAAALPALGDQSVSNAHPAVVRVIVPERDGTSYGSGALVAVNEQHGLVVTNWHVVRDASGTVLVSFPDGFHSAATVLKTDRDWDLAALAVWRPRVQPIPLAAEAPRPGEVLTIAGYGKGWYRASAGRCTQYLSPGGSHPYELVELSTGARQGDSGGPIINNRGELAGVLFGAAWGKTTGSYCGRVRWFLSSVADEFQRFPSEGTMIAQQQERGRGALASESFPARQISLGIDSDARPSLARAGENASRPALAQTAISPAAAVAAVPAAVPSPPATAAATSAEPTRADQLKTILAIIGAVLLFFHALRLIARAAG